MFRFLRIAVLLTILVIVAGNQLLTDSRRSSWDRSLWVTIYPIVADGEAGTQRYVDSLTPGSFSNIADFIEQQARRYNRQITAPLVIQLARPLHDVPPAIPQQGSKVAVALWSIKMRWWAWRKSRQSGLTSSDINLFVNFQQGERFDSLERSVGVKNASYGVINALASRNAAARNRIVLTHELLHILGASDKYNLANGQPSAPQGLANPLQSPLYPQQRAEIMGGRIATSAQTWDRPTSLSSCVIGELTAREIGWQ